MRGFLERLDRRAEEKVSGLCQFGARKIGFQIGCTRLRGAFRVGGFFFKPSSLVPAEELMGYLPLAVAFTRPKAVVSTGTRVERRATLAVRFGSKENCA